MKKMKKLTSILLAVVMVLSLAVTVSAAEGPYTITINNSAEGYTYAAYQIFSGDISKDANPDEANGTNAVLSNIQWGSSVTNAGDLESAASVAAKLAANEITVDQLLSMITLGDAVASDNTMTNGKYVIEGLEAGYYLVKNTEVPAGGAYTEYILEVVENSTVSPKADVPSVEKKVDDKNDSNTSEDEVKWQDSADYDIGDEVPFQLTAKLPNNVESYQGPYKVVFHDTQSPGLTFNAGSVKVYVDNTLVTAGYEVITTGLTDGCTFEIVIENAKAIGATDNSVITVEYTATLNENAVIGAVGNPNEVYLEYSNNPNWKPEGENPPPTGETPKDKVIVFTYKTIVNKVDKNSAPLTGAEFRLDKFVASEDGTETYKGVTGEWVAQDVVKNDAGTVFTFTGLDDGEYRLVETTTPAGYNTIADIYFTITATHDVEKDDPKLTDLSGNAENGEITFTKNVNEGSLSTDVINLPGNVLPETGGMGTTMFYVIGGLMAAAAVVLLVTKKRMHDAA